MKIKDIKNISLFNDQNQDSDKKGSTKKEKRAATIRKEIPPE
jgi:hypothetical protein